MPLPAAWSSRSATSAAAFPGPPTSSAGRSATRNTDHIVYRTSSLSSRALSLRAASAAPASGPPASVVPCSSDMPPLSATTATARHRSAPGLEERRDLAGRRAGRADAGGYAHPVVGRPADRQAGLVRDGRAYPRHPVQVADAVLRQRPAPASDPGHGGRTADRRGLRELGGGQRRELIVGP